MATVDIQRSRAAFPSACGWHESSI